MSGVAPFFGDFTTEALHRGRDLFQRAAHLPGTTLTQADREFLLVQVWRINKELKRRQVVVC